jgi:aminoglycoside phosphotransferase (APT) family kinase protein
VWYDQNNQTTTWHQWLLNSLTDRQGSHTAGWSSQLAKQPELKSLFDRCKSTIESLLPLCPSRGELIHGDLLHQNVLLNDAADKVTAIFSWKCSARGDFLYDVAWCTLWDAWHPVIAQCEIWQRTLQSEDLDSSDLENAGIRHHCYELQIAASHMGWYAWTEDKENMNRLVERINEILKRGPLKGTAKLTSRRHPNL